MSLVAIYIATIYILQQSTNAFQITCEQLSEPTTPEITKCDANDIFDTVILLDIATPITTIECNRQQEQIAYTLRAIKTNNSKIAYIEFDSNGPQTIIGLGENPYDSNIDLYFNFILDRANELCINALERIGSPDLYSGLSIALQQLKSQSATQGKDMNIMIYSNCRIESEINTICNEYGGIHHFADILMINNGIQFSELYDDNYIECLAEDKIYTNRLLDNSKYYSEILINIQNILCPIKPKPTRNIQQCSAMHTYEIDIIILNDVSCPLTQTECIDQQEQISYVLKSLKGIDNNYGLVNSNVGYIEFNGNNLNIIVELNNTQFNIGPIESNDIDEYFYTIKDSNVCNDVSQRIFENGNSNLNDAINEAIIQFNKVNKIGRDEKIIIFSNCMVNQNEINNICNLYQNNINQQFEVVMVNNGEQFDNNNDEYIMCLLGWDTNKLFTNDARDNDKFYDQILPAIQNEICSDPSPMPTQDPTVAPTMATVVSLSCTTRAGPTLTGRGKKSKVSCNNGETLVSCGIRGTQNIGGATINSNNECVALSNDNTFSFEAQAVCCEFPDGAIIDVEQVVSTPGKLVTAECNNNYILTGCHSYYKTGNYGKIRGSYTGSQSSPPQTQSWISTDNSCTAQSKSGATVTAIAQCIQFDTQYTLECNTRAKFTKTDKFGTCPTQYTMFGCNTWSDSGGTLDSYYVTGSDKCYVQQDGHEKQYANAICCQLKSSLPTNTIRRLIEYEHDLTGGYSNDSPCMTMEIKLATENLVPSNNEPDVGANIFLIGKALAAETNGIVVIPHLYEQDDDEDTTTTTTTTSTSTTTSTTATPIVIDDELEWHIDEQCLDNSQIDENYFPKSVFAPQELPAQAVVNDNGFSVSIPFTTPDSIVYVFKLDALPLKISHVCSGDVTVIGAIKTKNGELIKEAEAITIAPNESGADREKILKFDETVELDSDTTYDITFETINSYPSGCDLFTDVDLGSPGHDNSRRRMPDKNGYYTYDDFACQASPNSCKLGQGLAKSNAMKTAVATMCKNDLGSYGNQIKEGMFRLPAAQTALRDHLVRPGSLEVYDQDGARVYYNTSWPPNVEKPCIAIDESRNRVFAIGGFDASDGNAVDSIHVWDFDNDDLSQGGHAVDELAGWVLDKPRYGSSCSYWNDGTKEWLIVVSGMPNKQYEFEDKNQFFDDIRVFPIPDNQNDLNNWKTVNSQGKKTSSKPEGWDATLQIKNKNKNYINSGIINQRLLLVGNILYLFGGKTHKVSRDVVWRYDLNDINKKSGEETNAQALSVMTLAAKKSSPMIDQVFMNIATQDAPDIKPCYMIFGGQSYADWKLVEGEAGLTSDFLQLFCNQATGSTYTNITVGTRRLKEENILTLSEFDRLALQESKKRRRLIGAEKQEETEVLIKDYNYGLDGVWYNFTVKFELCYDNNQQLETAEQNYKQAIENEGEWQDYKNKTQSKILNESLKAYSQWSNGFGDVKIWDLDILSVIYAPDVNETVVCELSTQSESNNNNNNVIRRLAADFDADLSSTNEHDSPCVTLNIQLKTENLVPTNSKPDPISNIHIIGKVFANGTGGIVQLNNIIDVYDDDDDDNNHVTTTTTEEPFYTSSSTTIAPKKKQTPWNINPQCLGEPEFEDTYFPKGNPFAPQLTAKADLTQDGFEIKTEFTTPESIVYVFEVNKLPLQISHTCSNNIDIIGTIYKEKEIVQQTNIISVPPNEFGADRKKELLFVSTVELLPNTSYEINFKTDTSINKFSDNCDWNNIDLGDIGHNNIRRRRMPDENGYFTYDDFACSASPNSCTLGRGLAKSAAMKTAVSAMCNNNLGTYDKRVKAGIFKLAAGQTAIKNHLIRPGSLEVYDENGNRIFYDSTWPSNGENENKNIKKPCIAIDENTNRIFAIGGYDKNNNNIAVDDIKVWQFNDGNDLSKGGETMNELAGWVLDKPRYGSSCLYWNDGINEWLVVVSGMSDKKYEFQIDPPGKNQFFDDIRLFPIPKNENDLNLWKQIHSQGKKTSSKPEGNTVKKIRNLGVIDSRLLLIPNSGIIYFFGGKTHKVSRNITSRFDLNDINNNNTAAYEVMEIAKKKAAPIIDKTQMKVGINNNGEAIVKDCYMVFGGQSYENYGAVEITENNEPGLTKDFLQLFCNEQISETNPYKTVKVGRRRRLIDENIPSLTQYDLQMFEMGKRRRRLNEEENEKTQILISDYHYNLDGIWYDFNVNFELCYNNNDELRNGIQYYENIINNNWEEYKIEMSDKLLKESQIAYNGWSNGFGAVNITQLYIDDINYQFTPSPTQISHKERRNARWFAKNIDEINKKIKWIDGEFVDDDWIID